MCGITGFLDTSRSVNQARMLATATLMERAMELRGPDDEGVWADAAAGIALGSRRLAVLDLSPEGHQPMISASGRFVIVFNGEVYNYVDVRAALENEGASSRFRGGSDTEVMLAAFEHWGLDESLKRFNGMFAFALWDRRRQELHLVRDRFGEKPLYYGWCGGAGGPGGRLLLFGSELKALRAHPGFNAEIDPEALTLFLRHNYIPAPWSIYRGIRKLEPASILTIRGESGESPAGVRHYWSARATAVAAMDDPFEGTLVEAVDQLEALLSDSVRLRMVADVPVGAFLSGGIDSSTIVALMQEVSSRPVKTFTIGFNEHEYNEADHARGVARHLGADHTELFVTPGEAMEVIPSLPHYYDEPFADSSQIPTILVSRLARRQVTVSLSGDGGDELFGGYVRYHWGRAIWNATGWWPSPVKSAAAAVLSSISPKRWSRWLDWAGPRLAERFRLAQPGDKLHKLANVLTAASPQEMYLRLTSLWQSPGEVVRGAAEPRTAPTDPARWMAGRDLTHRMMYLDTVTYLPDDILVKLDRASMAVSLESRVPMLDPRVLEFAWRLPMSMKVSGGVGKHILRQVLYRHVPQAMVERPKTGFGIPVHEWIRAGLRPWAEELLDERRLREQGYFAPAPVRRKWKEHLAGHRNWGGALWGVLMFQAWLEEQQTGRMRQHDEIPATTAR